MHQTSLLIADAHPIVRVGIRSLFSVHAAFRVAGEAATYDEVLRHCRAIRPDIVIVDLDLPERGGLQTCREIRAACARSRVVMFSACDDHRSMLAAMSAGAERFVSKQESLDVLVEAALEIAARLRPAANKPPPEPARTGAKRSAAPPEASAVTMLYRLLAPQERRIIPLLERGLSNKEIARYLGLSHQTVRNYLANAARKSKVSGRGELLDLFSVCEFDFSQYPGLDSFDFSEPGRHPQSGPYTGTA